MGTHCLSDCLHFHNSTPQHEHLCADPRAMCVGCYAPDVTLLIMNEVRAIVHNDPRMTQVDCATKCDAEFDLIGGKDEAWIDRLCHDACDCAVNHHNCQQFGGFTFRPHSTRVPHVRPTTSAN